MASRSKHERRPERGSDTMEAIKPLIVLALFGTILYGAYSVVQKGPSPSASPHADAPEAPAFGAPEVEMPAATTVVDGSAAVPPAPAPTPVVPAPPAAILTASPVSPPPAVPPGAVAAAVAAPVAARATPPTPPAWSVPAAAPAAAAPPAVYLAAESAPPPAQEDVAAAAQPPAADRPERLATVATAAPPAALPQMPPPAASPPSSNAFATAWSDAHEKLAAGRYAEALTALSVWYDDPSLGLEESHRLEDLLGQLAGTVIYSQQDLLLPPHVVAQGETLPTIAAPLGISWQLLGKINGIQGPAQVRPGEHIKVIQGPFDAVVSVSRRRVSLQLRGAFAGSFPVVVGRNFLQRVGSTLAIVEIRRDNPSAKPFDPAAAVRRGIVLADGMVIESAPDLGGVSDNAAPGSLIVSVRDLEEISDILGPGSSVLIRQ